MKLLSIIIKPIAKYLFQKDYNDNLQGVENQLNILNYLIKNFNQTSFGKDYNFYSNSNNYDKICQVDIQEYESLKPYIERVKNGEENVLWKGKPIYFAKTSGTTSGAKFIPITKESIGHHMVAARNALFAYVTEKDNASFFSGMMIFLQGSPLLESLNGIKIGRLSGIVYHHVPAWLMRNRRPSFETNCIENWDEKVTNIVAETKDENMTLLSGIPPWCLMYFEQLLKQTNQVDLKALFPNLELYVHGGVNYLPYKESIRKLLGKGVDTIETYPASEGFFAYQDSQKEEGLLLNLNAGIFYEFVKSEEIFNDKPQRVHLGGVEIGVNYVLIVSTNAGLWAYNTGDTIKFVSLKPYRIVVTGRIKHFISAFGEHVIQEEVEFAISKAAQDFNFSIVEFTVAPLVSDQEGVSCHEWFVELAQDNEIDNTAFIQAIDENLQNKNIYYKDLRQGGILATIKFTEIKENGFNAYFEEKGKLGGQNKVQHLANDRNLANDLLKYVKK